MTYKPFDNVARFIHSVDRHALPKILNIHAKSIEVSDSDLSTVSSQADLLLVIDKAFALHIENEVNYKVNTGDRLLDYNVLAGKRLKLSVRSVLIQLRPEASGPKTNGLCIRSLPDGSEYLRFRYEIVQIWKIPAEKLFACGLGALPLAFIGDIEHDRIPDLIESTKMRLKRDTNSKTAGEIWTSIDILMGLRYERDQIDQWMKGIREMEESVTYKAIIEKGMARGEARGEARGQTTEAREILLKLATKLFGKPSTKERGILNKISDKSKLEDLVLRTTIVSSWAELLRK